MIPTYPSLFTPVALGALALPHRVLMAPMTRNRATPDGHANALMARYYAQRASAGLIVSEMTQISAQGRSYVNTPGLSSPAEAGAWRPVTGAVHAAGGRIVAQIAHGGRASHPSLLPGRELPVAPSALAPGGTTYTAEGPQPFVVPRPLATDELPGIVREFRDAVLRAREAGFDGVELHAANGYLLDQFIRDGSNQRSDRYGGSALNRARLLFEVAEAAADAWEPGRIGVRISPFNPYNSMADSNPAETFSVVARGLRTFGLAYLHVVEPVAEGADPGSRLTPSLRTLFSGAVILNGSLSAESADAAISRGEADAASFGAAFLANPDLPARLASGAPLNVPDPSRFYAGGATGYVDYPRFEEAA